MPTPGNSLFVFNRHAAIRGRLGFYHDPRAAAAPNRRETSTGTAPAGRDYGLSWYRYH